MGGGVNPLSKIVFILKKRCRIFWNVKICFSEGFRFILELTPKVVRFRTFWIYMHIRIRKHACFNRCPLKPFLLHGSGGGVIILRSCPQIKYIFIDASPNVCCFSSCKHTCSFRAELQKCHSNYTPPPPPHFFFFPSKTTFSSRENRKKVPPNFPPPPLLHIFFLQIIRSIDQ